MFGRSARAALCASVVLGALGIATLVVPAAAQASVSAVVESTGGGVTGPPSAQHANETLADAVAYVEQQGGGTITFSPSLTAQTITLTTTLPNIGYPTTITGPSGGTVTISGGGKYGIFDVSTSQSLTLSNLTLTGGIGTDASGDFVGGAIYAETGTTLVVQNSTITGNTAQTAGGAIAAVGSVEVQNSTISNNTAAEGGGLYTAQATIRGSTFSGNSSTYGGGIFSSGVLIISDSTFTGNNAPANGTEGAGGAILQYGGTGSSLTITSSTIVGNEAGGTSGTPAGGGGIYDNAQNPGEPVSLDDTVVAGNTANVGPDILTFGPDPDASASFSLIGNPTGDGITGATTTDLFGTAAAPLAPKLGPLQSNGGPTQTMLPLPGSPVIDAAAAPSGVSTDQRGDPRTVKLGFTEPSGGDGTDIGAVELQASEAGLPTVTAISPATGAAGTTVTITGTNLFPATEVLFGSTPAASITAETATQITATAPAGTGTVDIRVVAPAGESATVAGDRFSYGTVTSTLTSSSKSAFTTTFGNQRLKLTSPSPALCTADTAKLHAVFSTAMIKSSKKTKLTFKSVAFYIDKGVKLKKKNAYAPNVTSKKTPASENISLKGVKSGSHTLRLIASYTEHVRRGKKNRTAKVTKTIATKVRVC